MSDVTNNQNEALTPEEMDALVKQALPNKPSNEGVINTSAVDKPQETQPETEKLVANPEPVRLPTMGDIANIDRDKMELVGSEVLHEEVKVGEPDYNYVRPENAPKDEVTGPTAQEVAQIQKVTEASQAQQPAPEQGVIIENTKPEEKPQKQEIPGISIATQESIEKYIETMGEDMAAGKHIREALADVNPNLTPTPEQAAIMQQRLQEEEGIAEPNFTQMRSSETEPSGRAERAKEAIVVIDKIEAKNLEFTKEERAKLEEAEVIRVNEVNTVDLKSIRRKRERRTDVHKALQRRGNSMRHTNILLPASGYYAEMLGCAPYEIMTLQSEDDPLTDNQVKWNLIFEKIKWNSIGFSTFEEFMDVTAVADYETFIWGILRSTFEDVDRISINCTNEKCVTKSGIPYAYDHSYSVVEMLRAEELSERLTNSIQRVVNTRTIQEAKDAHGTAPVNDILGIELPVSGYVVEIGISTVNDFLNKTLDHLADENLEPQYRQAALIATALKGIGIPDEKGEYDFFEDQEEMTQIIFKLNSKDLLILAHKVQEHTSDVSFKFGFIDLQCPRCGTKTEYQPMDVSSILFYRNARSMNASVE